MVRNVSLAPGMSLMLRPADAAATLQPAKAARTKAMRYLLRIAILRDPKRYRDSGERKTRYEGVIQQEVTEETELWGGRSACQ